MRTQPRPRGASLLYRGVPVVGGRQIKLREPAVGRASVVSGAKPVTVQHIQVHGTALEGNLEGDAVDRDVIVFLPASYAKEKSRHYPVVYALHGYSIGAEQWTHEIHVPQTIEGAVALGPGNGRRASRYKDGAQRLDVFQLGDDR